MSYDRADEGYERVLLSEYGVLPAVARCDEQRKNGNK